MKLIIPCALLGATLACLYRGHLLLGAMGTGLIFFGWFIEMWQQYRPQILKPRDESPFTSQELRKIGIIAPDKYDEWLDEFARR